MDYPAHRQTYTALYPDAASRLWLEKLGRSLREAIGGEYVMQHAANLHLTLGTYPPSRFPQDIAFPRASVRLPPRQARLLPLDTPLRSDAGQPRFDLLFRAATGELSLVLTLPFAQAQGWRHTAYGHGCAAPHITLGKLPYDADHRSREHREALRGALAEGKPPFSGLPAMERAFRQEYARSGGIGFDRLYLACVRENMPSVPRWPHISDASALRPVA